MSFGLNALPGQNKIPAVQKTFQTTDGGAGNLGYFNQNNKKKKQDGEKGDSFVFSLSEESNDIFENEKQENKTENKIENAIKNLLSQIELYSDII